jgi:16S rRNA (guanine966-N2)-methyltransferase
MSALQPRIPGARVVDLFAGSGALGLECLSRGAAEAVFVERAQASIGAIRANIEALGAKDRTRVIQADAAAWAEKLGAGEFDRALADPPYDEGFLQRLLAAFQRTPFASELWIEHRSADLVPEGPSLRTRRYGDTAITRIEAPE